MRLVIDASTVVAEALRVSGRELIAHDVLELFVAAEAWNEAVYELDRRWVIFKDRGLISDERMAILQGQVQTLLDGSFTIITPQRYQDRLAEATWRIPRDPSDAPSVALALALECGIWTNDRDFFGCGLPVWVTEPLRSYVVEQEKAAN
ncbi:MAG: PIN domain-containing protein [Thermomicrobiales bacterium]